MSSSAQACHIDSSLPRLQPAEACGRIRMFSVLGAMFRCYQRHLSQKHVLFSLLFALCLFSNALGIGEVIWAVNCGGESHTDIHGIRYEADPLQEVGFASDYGKNLLIQRVVPQDQILYQTERYHLSTFSYDIPVWKDGDYVLVMKFSEVWFTSTNQKVPEHAVTTVLIVIHNSNPTMYKHYTFPTTVRIHRHIKNIQILFKGSVSE